MSKKMVAVLFGGQSSEHIVSCMSAANIIDQINRELYETLLIGITEDGHWIKVNSVEEIRSGNWKNGAVSAIISPDATEQCVVLIDGANASAVRVDVVFPILHGLFGEDGTIQGLLELARIPYVGCGVLASAVSMDKLYTKIIADTLGVRQADYVPVRKADLEQMDRVIACIETKFNYPVFIKPSNAGSSKGVTRAENRDTLIAGLIEASRHDSKILVEETIIGHEVECAVFGGGQSPITASGVGEIKAAADFYDFEAKYFNEESKTIINPQLPDHAVEKIRQTAISVFRAVDGYGLARVDFFVREDGEVIFNEINTMPGFTAISMYPMLWEAEGVDKKQLVTNLIEHAYVRYQ